MSGGGFKLKQLAAARLRVLYRFDGFHCWPGAPEHRAYLRCLHRHVFHVTAELDALHDDRELEFHDVRDDVERAVYSMGSVTTSERPDGHAASVLTLGSMSCEQIAAQVCDLLGRKYGGRNLSVHASEDGEFGATVVSAA